jgi:class 3 adenylate cyclase/tetratricopeptide (TPR) repeat protein
MSVSIENWLDQLGLGKYAGAFIENDVDVRALPYLTEADLRELGVSLGHRRVLLAATAKLPTAPKAHPDPRSAPAAAELRPPAEPSKEAEHRLLSVLFCDLVGSTGLSQRLNPEDMRDLMRRYQDAVAGAVTRYDGHVAKYLGDGVLAYFGWPLAYEDHAERAVRAGMEALAAVPVIRLADRTAISARVGIATGPVVVGDLIGASGREEGAVTGETPNLAARIQAAAAPGELLVAAETRKLIRGTFELEERGEQRLKGFERAVSLFRILDERHVESRFEATRGGALSALVGRVHELGMLRERWAIARTGQGQAVFVTGESGIGKSRLVEALVEHVAEAPHELIRLQCSPYHATSTLHPIIERLRRLAGFVAQEAVAERIEKLERFLGDLYEDVSAVAPLYAELLSVDTGGRYPKLELAPQDLKERTLATLVDRLVLLGRRSPVLLVVEDAHWIDPTTEEVLRRCAGGIRNLPVMMVTTHRPDWRADWATDFSHAAGLSIGRLDRNQIAVLVGSILGAAPLNTLVDDIMARTDGVPLFVEELTWGVLERKGAGDAETATIPATLQGSLMAQLDRLPGAARNVAMIASVIGREFSEELLNKATGLDDAALAEALEHLARAQLVVPSGVVHGAHMFRHALIQDVAYQALLNRTRRRHHRRIGEILLADHREVAELQPELIARHFSEAGLPGEALPFWTRAAERALKRSANYEAVSHCERALATASELQEAEAKGPQTLAAELLLGRALEAAGRLSDALAHLRAGAAMARECGDVPAFVQAALGFENVLFLSNEPVDEGIALLEEARTQLAGGDERARCQVLSRLARANLIAGKAAGATRYSRQALNLARRIDDPLTVLDSLINNWFLPASTRSASDLAGWRGRLDEMFALANAVDDDDSRGRVLSLDVYVSAEMCDRARMDQALEQLSLLGEARQRMLIQWIARHGRAMQAILEGDLAAAEQHAETALELGRRTLGDQVEGIYGIQMFTIRREQGRLAEVAPVIKRFVDENPDRAAWKPGFALIACDLGFREPALRILDELAETEFAFPLDAKHSTTLAYLAEVCAALEDQARAEQLYQLLIPYKDLTVTAGVTTVCYGAAGRYLGALAGVLGDWGAAEEHFEAALATNQAMRAWPWLAHTRYAYAQMLRLRDSAGDEQRAHALLDEALETAARLNMVALRKKLRGREH